MSIRGTHPLAVTLVLGVVLAMVIPTGIASVAGEDQSTEVEDCQTITEPGRYVLTRNITDGGEGNFTFISETCVVIDADDVVFDAGGHTIDGLGVSDTTAIGTREGGQFHNVTVKNVRVTDWNRGVYLGNVEDATIRDVNASGNSFGIFVEHAEDVTVQNATATRNFIGLYHADTRGTTFEHNAFRGNHVGGNVPEESARPEARNERGELPHPTARLTACA